MYQNRTGGTGRNCYISDEAMDGKGEKKDIDIWYVENDLMVMVGETYI